jgi:5-methylcytosine-specific restriction endonuclease McrA
MTLPAPPADAQLLFLQNVQRLLAEGLFTATYKFALLQSLADLAVLRGDDTGDPLTVSTGEIAEAMIRLYWRQAAPFPGIGADQVLRQSTHRQAEIIAHIAATRADTATSLAQLQAQKPAWDRLVRRVQRVVQEQPLWKLQTVGAQPLDFLYPNAPGATSITLRPGVAYCLRAFHGLVSELVQGAWVRHIRRMNGDVMGSTIDLTGFLFGTERSHLGIYLPVLAEVQRGLCFYCQRPIGSGGEVDHFIPWSLFPVDLGHNFVLAHASCNSDKSSHLADIGHLERWVERNEVQRSDLTAWLRSMKIDVNLGASRHVARWAYAQTERACGQVWVSGRLLVPLAPDWHRLLAEARP